MINSKWIIDAEHAKTIGKSYYANVHMFSSLEPLTDPEGVKGPRRICKGDESDTSKEKTFSLKELEGALNDVVDKPTRERIKCRLKVRKQ